LGGLTSRNGLTTEGKDKKNQVRKDIIEKISRKKSDRNVGIWFNVKTKKESGESGIDGWGGMGNGRVS